MNLEQFIKEMHLPLVARVNDLELNLKKEHEGIFILNISRVLLEKEDLLNKICELEDQLEDLTETLKKLNKVSNLKSQEFKVILKGK